MHEYETFCSRDIDEKLLKRCKISWENHKNRSFAAILGKGSLISYKVKLGMQFLLLLTLPKNLHVVISSCSCDNLSKVHEFRWNFIKLRTMWTTLRTAWLIQFQKIELANLFLKASIFKTLHLFLPFFVNIVRTKGFLRLRFFL